MRSILLLSGGVDSTVLAYKLAGEGHRLHCVAFRYGQRAAEREIAAARRTAAVLHAHFTEARLDGALGRSALTGDSAVPAASVEDREATEPAVVPCRNFVFLTSAASLAVASCVRAIYFGANAGDATSFDDCGERFLHTIGSPLSVVAPGVSVVAPFVRMAKAEIVALGDSLGVPWRDAYSCYAGLAEACGSCGACLSRAEAFGVASVADVPEGHKFPAYRYPGVG